MINALFDQPNYLAVKSMLDATVLRQQAITSNIANVETPGYKRLEVTSTFETQLKKAFESGKSESFKSLRPTIGIDRTAVAANLDGNTVKLDEEMMALNQNYIEHTLETQLVSGSLMKLRMAITGRR